MRNGKAAPCSNLYPIRYPCNLNRSKEEEELNEKGEGVYKQEPTNPITAPVAWSPKS